MSGQPVTFLKRAESLVGSVEARAVGVGAGRLAEARRRAAVDYGPFEAMSDRGRAIRLHTLANLDRLLTHFADQVQARGGRVHFADDAREANEIVTRILDDAGARLVVKSKSMVTEEIRLNPHLEASGLEVVESDLGEFIVQLAGDSPSHIVAPVLHRTRGEIGALFAEHLGVAPTDDPHILNQIARDHLRSIFLNADAGITGVNFGIAESGSLVLVANEGNARLTSTAPRVHIAVMGMERVVPRWEDAAVLLELLARSATGQRLSAYTNVITGPRREGDADGPDELHLVIVDNGRSRMLAGETAEILACIRCGACLNICPVFRSVGGHAYGSVYSGPVGSVVTPGIEGMDLWWDLAHASTLCGACEEVCPVGIQIPSMLLSLRSRAVDEGRGPTWIRRGMRSYARAATEPYRWRRLKKLAWLSAVPFSSRGWIRRMPGPGRGWTQSRDFPTPARQSFAAWWEHRDET